MPFRSIHNPFTTTMMMGVGSMMAMVEMTVSRLIQANRISLPPLMVRPGGLNPKLTGPLRAQRESTSGSSKKISGRLCARYGESPLRPRPSMYTHLFLKAVDRHRIPSCLSDAVNDHRISLPAFPIQIPNLPSGTSPYISPSFGIQ